MTTQPDSEALDRELAKLQATGIIEAEPARLDSPLVGDVERERVDWLWRGRLARGKLSILDGDPGLGKSTVTLDLVARLSTGSPLPDGEQLDAPINTILLSAEDGVADTIRPRLEAAGADLSRIRAVRGVTEEDGPRPVTLPGDLGLLADLADQDGASLVVVDPLMAFLGGAIDSHRDQDIRRALHAIASMIERTKLAGLIVRHLNKNTGGNPLYRGGGSIGIIGAARAGMVIAPDPADDTRLILASTKSNLATKPKSLAYRLVGDELHDCGRISWQGTSELSADAILNPPRETKVDQAEGWLEDLLFDGPKLQSEVKALAAEVGHSWATIRRAKDDLGITSYRESVEGGDKGSGAWYWALPSHANGHKTKVLNPADLSDLPLAEQEDLRRQEKMVHDWNASLPPAES